MAKRMRAPLNWSHRSRSAGVSLLEVMFAIGVTAVGLLGVMALVPLGVHEVGRGNAVDRSAHLAMNAMEEFRARGFANPGYWVNAAGASVWSAPVNWKRSFAIDPQFVAANASVSATNYSQGLFPYTIPPTPPLLSSPVIPSQPRMTRITLPPGTLASGRLWADEACLLNDELVFDIPAEKTLLPLQQYTFLTSGEAAKRKSEETFSWMATLSPKLEPVATAEHDAYILSMIVFQRRDPAYAMFDDQDADGTEDSGEGPSPDEAVVEVTDFPGTGYRGGDVVLCASSPEALAVRRGGWLLLMGWFDALTPSVPSTPATFADDIPLFRWYRVVDVDAQPLEDPVGSGKYYLDVTLHGPDWPYASMVTDPATNTKRSYAAIIRNIVTVHEKTIRLEYPSLHTFW